jgi:hypothetical protein
MIRENHNGMNLFPFPSPAHLITDIRGSMRQENNPVRILRTEFGWIWKDSSNQWWDSHGALPRNATPDENAPPEHILVVGIGVDKCGTTDKPRLTEIPVLSLAEEKNIPIEAWIKTILCLKSRNHILQSGLRDLMATISGTTPETIPAIFKALATRGIILKESRRTYIPWKNGLAHNQVSIIVPLRNGKRFLLSEPGPHKPGEYPSGGILIKAWSPELKDPDSGDKFGLWTYIDNSPDWTTACSFLKAAGRQEVASV